MARDAYVMVIEPFEDLHRLAKPEAIEWEILGHVDQLSARDMKLLEHLHALRLAREKEILDRIDLIRTEYTSGENKRQIKEFSDFISMLNALVLYRKRDLRRMLTKGN